MKIVVTGAAGFVGSAVVARLSGEGCKVVAASRKPMAATLPGVRYVDGVDLGRPDLWDAVLTGADVLVHTAALVHRSGKTARNSDAEYHRVNAEGTRTLAELAARAGVRRLIFLSSIKVNGECSQPDRPFRAADPPNPADGYARSKLAAERLLQTMAGEGRLECVVVRPPLVYGPGVKANFHTMMKLLTAGVPLPFGAIDAKRSLLALDNLVDLLWACVRKEQAAGQVLLASDGEDLSLSDLLRRLGDALGRPARLLPVPPRVLERAARFAGRGDLARRLLAPLQVDCGPTRELLGWQPPVRADDALRATARAFIEERRR